MALAKTGELEVIRRLLTNRIHTVPLPGSPTTCGSAPLHLSWAVWLHLAFILTLSARANRRAAAGVANSGGHCLQRRETEFVWRTRLSSKRAPSRKLIEISGAGPRFGLLRRSTW